MEKEEELLEAIKKLQKDVDELRGRPIYYPYCPPPQNPYPSYPYSPNNPPWYWGTWC